MTVVNGIILDEFLFEWIILGNVCLYFVNEGLIFCIGGLTEVNPSFNRYGTIIAGFFSGYSNKNGDVERLILPIL